MNAWPSQKHEPAYLVATYSVRKLDESSASGGGRADRARPKSQSYGEDVDE